jgi:uncharacterized membrane protein (UPF0127 family)
MKFLELHTADGCCIARRVKLACSFRARCVGLLSRTGVPEHEGLLLVPGGSIHTFGLRFAIDVVFLSRQMRVLGVAERVQPWRVVIAPRGTARVLELAAGRIAHTGLTAGTYLTVDAAPPDAGERTTIRMPRVRNAPCERSPIQFSLRLAFDRRCTGSIPARCSAGEHRNQNPAALSARIRLSRSDDAERWNLMTPLFATPSPRMRRRVALTVAPSSSKSP